jgi:hypothetical protein
MRSGLPNIVQVEFFLTDKNATLEDLFRDFEKRMAEDVEEILEGVPPNLVGSRIKAVARFFDTRGYLTRLVDETKKLKDKHLSLAEKVDRASGLRKLYLKIHLLVVLEWLRQCEELRLPLAASELGIAVQGKHPVALETWDHHFLPLRDDEAHELLEAVANAKQVWIFVFEHNDLLSDTNKSVAHAM